LPIFRTVRLSRSAAILAGYLTYWIDIVAGLGEHVIRDLNDEINKRIREKHHWEKRIAQLGGSDYTRSSQPQAYDADGISVQGTRGYKYFGAAKNLPGVRELFEKEAPPPPRRSKQDMLSRIEPDYYGFRDDDDAALLEAEALAEERLRAQAMREWDEAEAHRKAQVAALVRHDLYA
jgi:pre-mRNA-splicing factor ISY1